MTKVYELAGKAAGKIYTEFLGNKIELNFRGGMGSSGSNTAVLITSEPFIQDAIEADPRFGSMIKLARRYDNPVKARNDYHQHSGTPMTGTVEPATAPEPEEDPEEQKKRDMRARRAAAAKGGNKKASEKKPEPDPEPEPEAEKVVTFKNANEALHYFIGKGIEVNADNLEALLEQHNCKIVEE